MKTTREHFNLTTDELIQIKHDSDYTKEECLILDAGEKVSFFDNISEWENEKLDYMLWLDNKGLQVTEILETINGRIAIVSNY